MTLCELYRLRSGRTKCKMCGGKACTISGKCHACAMLDEVAGSVVDDIIKDYGSIIALIPIPPQLGNSLKDFVGMLRIKASTKTSKRLVYLLERITEELEERR